MSKRVSLSNPLLDQQLLAMARAQESETNAQQLKLVKKALAEVIKNDLTGRQKQMIVLYYYEGMRMREIAEQLQLDPSTVSRTLTRARRNILQYLKYLL